MKKSTLLAFCLCLSLIGATAAEARYNIVTGGPTGTYIQIGNDLSRLLERNGRTLNVLESNGSQDNIYDVSTRAWTPLGIVQSDVLGWIQYMQDVEPELRRIAQTTRMVYPLYNEEIHILAREGIDSLRDLSGKRVATGKIGSGTNLTATLLLGSVSITLGREVNAGGREAAEMLKRGAIDAMFYVAGYPVKLFAEEISRNDNLHLLPLTDRSLREFYSASRIPAGTYSWQPEAVPVVAVKAVLMTYEYDRRNTYFSDACDFVGFAAWSIRENLDRLRNNGHPKWNSVDLNEEIPGWQQARCVRQGLSQRPARPAAPNPGRSDRACERACDAESNPVRRTMCRARCASL